jgi:hypothetical protein
MIDAEHTTIPAFPDLLFRVRPREIDIHRVEVA